MSVAGVLPRLDIFPVAAMFGRNQFAQRIQNLSGVTLSAGACGVIDFSQYSSDGNPKGLIGVPTAGTYTSGLPFAVADETIVNQASGRFVIVGKATGVMAANYINGSAADTTAVPAGTPLTAKIDGTFRPAYVGERILGYTRSSHAVGVTQDITFNGLSGVRRRLTFSFPHTDFPSTGVVAASTAEVRTVTIVNTNTFGLTAAANANLVALTAPGLGGTGCTIGTARVSTVTANTSFVLSVTFFNVAVTAQPIPTGTYLGEILY